MNSKTSNSITTFFFKMKVRKTKISVTRKILISSMKGRGRVYIEGMYNKDINVIVFNYLESKGYLVKYSLGGVYIEW